jgi:tRNA threonylcarbamoyl adenosine modification protein YeaZ
MPKCGGRFPRRGKEFSTVWKTGMVMPMNLLALEFSTETASLALLTDGTVVASRPVDAGHRRSQWLFDAVEELWMGAGWSLADVDAFAVGRGPGAYTGLRVSLTAANGWALPEHKPVWTVSSAAALAAAEWAEHPEAAEVVAWGMARRGTIWAGRFKRAGEHAVKPAGDWQLLPAGQEGSIWPEARWTAPERRPRAEWVGRLFFAGDDSEALQPIYLHPAVATAPRFDADGYPLEVKNQGLTPGVRP